MEHIEGILPGNTPGYGPSFETESCIIVPLFMTQAQV